MSGAVQGYDNMDTIYCTLQATQNTTQQIIREANAGHTGYEDKKITESK